MPKKKFVLQRKPSLKDTLMCLPIGQLVFIPVIEYKVSVVRGTVHTLRKLGLKFSVSERGCNDGIYVTRLASGTITKIHTTNKIE